MAGRGAHQDDDSEAAEESAVQARRSETSADDMAEREEDEDEDEDGEEDEEPRLKYTSLSKAQESLYKKGDATSAMLVAGDKLIIGTHNGFVHVLLLPQLRLLRTYHPHTASISAISIAPFPPPASSSAHVPIGFESLQPPSGRHGANAKRASQHDSPVPSNGTGREQTLSMKSANAVHIATASLDGNVCVCSLLDHDDVIMRKFGRPLQAIALSPDFKTDRTYLSGGLAGELILTVGGAMGKTEASNAHGLAAGTAGWLGSIGIGASGGVDTVRHSGEGSISTIKWSLSGRYAVWVNEYGIKVLRTSQRLESGDTDLAWKRMSHIDRPNRPEWEEMSGVWKAHAEWIDEAGLEIPTVTSNELSAASSDAADAASIRSSASIKNPPRNISKEKLAVGWGDTIWIIVVHPASAAASLSGGDRRLGRVEVVNLLRTDGTVSGLNLYTPNQLLTLIYVLPDQALQSKSSSSKGTDSKRGRPRRQNALQPELRIIDISSGEELETDTLNVSRFQSLTATDYHLGVLPVARASRSSASRGALGMIGDLGGTIWDASSYSTKALGNAALDATMYSARLFASGTGMRSPSVSSDRAGSSKASSDRAVNAPALASRTEPIPDPALLTRGMKIFVQSPYDCILATKPTMVDHLAWLVDHARYEEAWDLLETQPEILVGMASRADPEGSIDLPIKADDSLAEFLADSTPSSPSTIRQGRLLLEQERHRIGTSWMQQLVNSQNWEKAGRTAERVLDTAAAWERWIWVFVEAQRHDDIALHIPGVPLQPPISSTVYEVMLGHYIAQDRVQLANMLNVWPPILFDAASIIEALQRRLRVGNITKTTVEGGIRGRDWRILHDALARVYLANGQPRDALRCYVRAQDADAALALIRDEHLLDAVGDDIAGLVLLRVSQDMREQGSLTELEEASAEPVELLVAEAHSGVVRPDAIVQQLQQDKFLHVFLFFYFRGLWQGKGDPIPTSTVRSRRALAISHVADEGRAVVNDFADSALPLFAKYDRQLLFSFLKASHSYTLSLATTICDDHQYIPELVFLLAKEGRIKDALHAIINKLDDVSQAIAFAQEQDDADLWDDLIKYSMQRPTFIKALLEQAGTAIDPVKLVRRIPEGLHIEGLRDSLTRMIKELELQDSISSGVAQVLQSEVSQAMYGLRRGRKRGIRFEVESDGKARQISADALQQQRSSRRRINAKDVRPGRCCGCGQSLYDTVTPLSPDSLPPDSLVAFPCTHVFHTTCLLSYSIPSSSQATDRPTVDFEPSKADAASATNGNAAFPSGAKADHASDHREPALPALEMTQWTHEQSMGRKVAYAQDLQWRLDAAAEAAMLDSTGPSGRLTQAVDRTRGTVTAHCPLEIHRHLEAVSD